jgi:hypothetical protein
MFELFMAYWKDIALVLALVIVAPTLLAIILAEWTGG